MQGVEGEAGAKGITGILRQPTPAAIGALMLEQRLLCGGAGLERVGQQQLQRVVFGALTSVIFPDSVPGAVGRGAFGQCQREPLGGDDAGLGSRPFLAGQLAAGFPGAVLALGMRQQRGELRAFGLGQLRQAEQQLRHAFLVQLTDDLALVVFAERSGDRPIDPFIQFLAHAKPLFAREAQAPHHGVDAVTGHAVAFLNPLDALLLDKRNGALNGLARGGGSGQIHHRDTEGAKEDEAVHDLGLMENSLDQFTEPVNAAFA